MGLDVSRAYQGFCAQWNVIHKTDIPYNPQGQGIVEHALSSLKTQLQKIKAGLYSQMPHNTLNHTLFMLNFLNMNVHEQSAADCGIIVQRPPLLKQGRETLALEYGEGHTPY